MSRDFQLIPTFQNLDAANSDSDVASGAEESAEQESDLLPVVQISWLSAFINGIIIVLRGGRV